MPHRSPFRCALLCIALALPSVAAADVWDEAYTRGGNAIKAKNYAVAVDELERAIADEPDEFLSDEQPRNGYTAYLPHFWLGVAKFNLGDVDGALREWKISEEQGVVLKSPYYAEQLREWRARATSQKPAPVKGAPPRPQPKPAPVPVKTLPPIPATTTAPVSFPSDTAPTSVPTDTAPTSFPADKQLKWEANIAFNTPEQINLDEHHVIKLLLDMHRPANELAGQLPEGDKAATATIKISDLVEARLSGAAFEIRPITPETQAVSAGETTEWQWEVTPKQDGNHRLFLTVNAIFGSGADQRKRSIRTYDRSIEVRVPPRATGGWLVPMSVLAVVVVLLSFFFALKRRTPPAVDETIPTGDQTVQAPVVASSDPTQFRKGQVIGERYRIVRLLGQGGMGAVYAAEDGEFEGELVALKTILTPGEGADQLLARFKKEIQLARRVAHPNVCRIFDVGYHVTGAGKTMFVSMEYITGAPLKTVIQQKGRLNEAEALAIIRDVAAALDATHAAGLIHRDVKSANVMLAEDGRAVLTDFGVACLSNPGADELSLTRTGAIVGTPAYMAPEQIEGAPLTAATDIYAFGTVIFEMVTGRLPYEGDTPMSILAKRLREPPRSPAHFVPNLKTEWEQTILRCLEHDPSKRFRSAMDVSRALDRAADTPTLPM
ncbi:MAG TPA: serine/threonine-protein kinase [Thermoanaerobaculia bacterium]|nr:serine/threonine-protein kinase [Thermoanaerobaculia bacterium]